MYFFPIAKMRINPEITPPGYWGLGQENIQIIKNFISSEELMKMHIYAESIQNWRQLEDNWNDRVHSFELIQQSSIDMASFFKSKTDNVRKIISQTLNVQLSEVVPSVVRWRVGDEQAPHADKQDVDGSPNPYPENDIASLIYINDDYGGGEIYFPKQNVKLKPSAGSLVFFPGDINYLHGVTEVTDGIRYTMPNFWSVIGIDTSF